MSEITGVPAGSFYGRAWNVTISMGISGGQESLLTVSSSSFEPEALRVVFFGGGTYGHWDWFGEVEITNLSVPQMQSILAAAQQDAATSGSMRVLINAGYQNGPFGKVFDMYVYQIMIERREVTDWILRLRCASSVALQFGNFSAITVKAGYNYTQLIKMLSGAANTPIPIGYISKNIGQQTFPRGRTIFGDPKTFYRDICQDDQVAQWWMDRNELFLTSPIDETDTSQTVVISPETGLVGDPQQVQYGVKFTSLMNANIRIKAPLMLVKLSNVIINQMQISVPSLPPWPLDPNGLYKVMGITHRGDTRGNDWYTEVYGLNSKMDSLPEFM